MQFAKNVVAQAAVTEVNGGGGGSGGYGGRRRADVVETVSEILQQVYLY